MCNLYTTNSGLQLNIQITMEPINSIPSPSTQLYFGMFIFCSRLAQLYYTVSYSAKCFSIKPVLHTYIGLSQCRHEAFRHFLVISQKNEKIKITRTLLIP